MSETTLDQPISEQTITEKPNKAMRISNIALWVSALAIITILTIGLLNANATRPEAGQAAPAFNMEFFNGYEWENKAVADLSELEGQVVVVNFWASWCVECRLEADLLESTWQKYRDKGVVFVGIAYVDVEPKSLEYLEEFNVTYPNAPDLGSRISSDYEITGVPETFFIGKDGTIAHVTIGPVDAITLESIIEGLLADTTNS